MYIIDNKILGLELLSLYILYLGLHSCKCGEYHILIPPSNTINSFLKVTSKILNFVFACMELQQICSMKKKEEYQTFFRCFKCADKKSFLTFFNFSLMFKLRENTRSKNEEPLD